FSPHAGIDLATLVRPELVTFKSFDGLELSGWLYKPKNQNGPGPYVISFHGGPEGQERAPFRSDYQALLAQGIGVFAPNVRGSSGFGKKFVNLDNGELRVNGVKDIKACVDYLVNNHIAGPKRIGITGGSYGGYMTMAGLTEYPDMFAAGVDLFGIVNFITFFEHTEPWMAAISTTEYGDPKTQKEMLDRLSPFYKLDRIKAATMEQMIPMCRSLKRSRLSARSSNVASRSSTSCFPMKATAGARPRTAFAPQWKKSDSLRSIWLGIKDNPFTTEATEEHRGKQF